MTSEGERCVYTFDSIWFFPLSSSQGRTSLFFQAGGVSEGRHVVVACGTARGEGKTGAGGHVSLVSSDDVMMKRNVTK